MSVESRDYESPSQLKVFVRMRPLRKQNTKRCARVIDKGVALNYKDKIHQMYFDGVFDQDAKQEKVFNEACRPILQNVLEGCNGALFVYGQTGTGKTYTMGTLETIKREDQGLIPLAFKYLFDSLSNKQDYSISVSFLQIYMEDIYDLLNHEAGKLQIRQDLQTGQTYVHDLTVVPIANFKQSIELINQGLQQRKTGPQKMNQLSSRSHTIVSINLVQKLNNNQYLTSNFSLIDLAGSQRVKKSNSTGLRLKQAQFINSSLSALGNVIAGLAQNDYNKFIPYRSSKLTRTLKNSLSGKSRVAVICTLETSQDNIHQTYSTLIFADRCKEIRFLNQPVINIEDFQEMGLEQSNKQQLDRLRSKQKQYIQTIKSLKQGGSVRGGDSKRQHELSHLIETIYNIFGQMNSHLRKSVQGETSIIEPQKPKPVLNTPIKQLTDTVRGLAQQTIDLINSLISSGGSNKGYKANTQSETLMSIVLELVRSNLKTYQNQLREQKKQPLQKQFMVKQYGKQLKQGIINKLKAKKLKIASNFEQIWAESNALDQNPLQSLLNNLRKGQLNPLESKPSKDNSSIKQPVNAPNNPKDILKRITKQQSQRKQKQQQKKQTDNLQNNQQKQIESGQKQSPQDSPSISYFQKSATKTHTPQPNATQNTNSSIQIRKLLDNLRVQKNQYEERKNNN